MLFRSLIEAIVLVLWLLMLGRVIISWVDPMARGGVAQFIVSMTEPLLAPIRRVLPATGMLDWSPFILMVGLGILLRFVAA